MADSNESKDQADKPTNEPFRGESFSEDWTNTACGKCSALLDEKDILRVPPRVVIETAVRIIELYATREARQDEKERWGQIRYLKMNLSSIMCTGKVLPVFTWQALKDFEFSLEGYSKLIALGLLKARRPAAHPRLMEGEVFDIGKGDVEETEMGQLVQLIRAIKVHDEEVDEVTLSMADTHLTSICEEDEGEE